MAMVQRPATIQLTQAKGFFGFRDYAPAQIVYENGRFSLWFSVSPLRTAFEHDRRLFTLDLMFEYNLPCDETTHFDALYWQMTKLTPVQFFDNKEHFQINASYDFSFLSKEALLQLGLIKSVFRLVFDFTRRRPWHLHRLMKPTFLLANGFRLASVGVK